MTINCRGKLLDLSTPKVMGILNVTPDSFYTGGRFADEDGVIDYVDKMIRDGADIIDVGGMSSRPGAEIISEEEESRRVIPVLQGILKRFPEAVISVDTIRARVAEQALEAGVHIINDITAGRFEPAILETAAKFRAPFIVMHIQGMPATMQHEPNYANVLTEVFDFFTRRIEACREAGLTDIILDPGFGFGKNIEHNYTLLRNLEFFTYLHLPILAGLSRKSMVCKVLHVNPKHALNGTTAVNMLALMNGANLLRVHDVKEAKQAVEIFEAYRHKSQLNGEV